MTNELKKWMPIFWGDYHRGTQQFTNATEHGAYLLLIGYCWHNNGVLPQNDEARRRIAKCTPRQWKLIRDLVSSKFDDVGRNERCSQELAYAIEKSKRLSANAKHRLSIGSADADTPTPTPTPTEVSKKVSKKDTCSSSDERFRIFWENYPRKVGKKAAEKAFKKAVKEASLEIILSALAVSKGGWKDEQYTPHPTTWLNQGRYLDHQATPTKPFYRPPIKGNGHVDQRQDLEKSTAKTTELLDEGTGIRDEDAAGLGDRRGRHH